MLSKPFTTSKFVGLEPGQFALTTIPVSGWHPTRATDVPPGVKYIGPNIEPPATEVAKFNQMRLATPTQVTHWAILVYFPQVQKLRKERYGWIVANVSPDEFQPVDCADVPTYAAYSDVNKNWASGKAIKFNTQQMNRGKPSRWAVAVPRIPKDVAQSERDSFWSADKTRRRKLAIDRRAAVASGIREGCQQIADKWRPCIEIAIGRTSAKKKSAPVYRRYNGIHADQAISMRDESQLWQAESARVFLPTPQKPLPKIESPRQWKPPTIRERTNGMYQGKRFGLMCAVSEPRDGRILVKCGDCGRTRLVRLSSFSAHSQGVECPCGELYYPDDPTPDEIAEQVAAIRAAHGLPA